MPRFSFQILMLTFLLGVTVGFLAGEMFIYGLWTSLLAGAVFILTLRKQTTPHATHIRFLAFCFIVFSLGLLRFEQFDAQFGN